VQLAIAITQIENKLSITVAQRFAAPILIVLYRLHFGEVEIGPTPGKR
jgi:hypothetical protein